LHNLIKLVDVAVVVA